MNRLDQTFKQLKAQRKKAFIAFITAGDPNLATTEKLVLSFEQAGVDVIELGVPFSDPLADGPTIQAASQRALKHHVTLDKILGLVKRIRVKSQIPIALMTYYNPVFHYGEEKFVVRAVKAGVDGLIIPDLPPEEAAGLIKISRKHNCATVFFLSPTTTKERMTKIVQASTGFIYYVSLTGVTGARTSLPSSAIQNVRQAKKLTGKPICVGFGVSTPAQVKSMSRIADGVIVGSAIIKEIEKNHGKAKLISNVTQFVRTLVAEVA
jgi:tryptophan synthase alpha chain